MHAWQSLESANTRAHVCSLVSALNLEHWLKVQHQLVLDSSPAGLQTHVGLNIRASVPEQRPPTVGLHLRTDSSSAYKWHREPSSNCFGSCHPALLLVTTPVQMGKLVQPESPPDRNNPLTEEQHVDFKSCSVLSTTKNMHVLLFLKVFVIRSSILRVPLPPSCVSCEDTTVYIKHSSGAVEKKGRNRMKPYQTQPSILKTNKVYSITVNT